MKAKEFFVKLWTSVKAFSIKAGKWIVANKVISIPVACVLVAGVACSIALPIALHEHKFSEEWAIDDGNHWHNATCSHEEEKADFGAHVYDNACDTTCNVCGATRIVGAHVYDNACDTTCNVCGATRMVGAHVYDNACDTACNNCGATRAITHDHADTLTAGDTTHYYLCSVCGDKKDEVAHEFVEVANDTYFVSETDTTVTYKKSCVCGVVGENFTVNKTVATISNVGNTYVYSGSGVAITFDTNSNGAITYTYYEQGNDTPLTEAPKNVGDYSVVVSVAGNKVYTPVVSEKVDFEITPKLLAVPTVLEKTYDSTSTLTYTFDENATGTGESVTVKLDMRDRQPESNIVKNAGEYDETTVDLWITEFVVNETATDNYDFVDEYYHNQSTYDITVNKKVLEGEWSIGVSWLYQGLSYSSEKELYWYVVQVPAQYGVVSSEMVVLLVYFDTEDINAQVVEAQLTAAAANVNYIYDSEKLILTNPIKDTTNSFNSVLTIGCKTAQSYTANMVAGQKVYIKINGAGGTLNDFYFKATTDSTATYTYELFRANDRTTPIDYNAVAGQHEIYQDIYDTIDFYLVVTCVTSGEISITSAE